jgi:Mn-dependent DtxR family transcriptional regulator
MPVTGRPLPSPEDDAVRQAKARALASPLRMRVLRLCLHEARTNRELAEELGVNPGTLLHHVRSLVDNGFLVAEPARKGARGAREVPYRATGLSWRAGNHNMGHVLLETFLQEIEGLPSEDLEIARLGLKLNENNRRELIDRFQALLNEYAARDSDPDGRPISLLFVEHPDLPRDQRAKPR